MIVLTTLIKLRSLRTGWRILSGTTQSASSVTTTNEIIIKSLVCQRSSPYTTINAIIIKKSCVSMIFSIPPPVNTISVIGDHHLCHNCQQSFVPMHSNQCYHHQKPVFLSRRPVLLHAHWDQDRL